MALLALIVDDEAPARAELRFLLEAIGGVEVVGEAASVREALALASRVDYDVVFLDINLPDLTGMDAARELGDWPRSPAVVFVTAHDDHAVQAFTVDAIDYLLKPVSEERLATLRAARADAPRRRRPRRTAARRSEGAGRRATARRRCSTRTTCSTPRPTATAAGSTPAASALLSTQSMRELEDAAAGDGVLPHPPLATSSTCAAWSRWRRSRPGRSRRRLADGTRARGGAAPDAGR